MIRRLGEHFNPEPHPINQAIFVALTTSDTHSEQESLTGIFRDADALGDVHLRHTGDVPL